MTKYVRAPGDDVVHLIDVSGDGEFTFCGRDYCQQDELGGFNGEFCPGPVACSDCKREALSMRKHLRGVKLT